MLAMDVARDDQELLVVTENGYGKRTPIPDYPVKGRGTMGVKTIALTENKGALAGALVVREHQELVFISQNGMVQRTSVRGINRYGRASQGVRVMNIRDDDQVSAVALVVESEAPTAATVAEDELAPAEEGVAPVEDGGRTTAPPRTASPRRPTATSRRRSGRVGRSRAHAPGAAFRQAGVEPTEARERHPPWMGSLQAAGTPARGLRADEGQLGAQREEDAGGVLRLASHPWGVARRPWLR